MNGLDRLIIGIFARAVLIIVGLLALAWLLPGRW